MPIDTDLSVQDEAYLATIAAEPKMTMDEVGADIEEHGHVPVTPETATQDPFTAKGSLSYALDESLSPDTDLEHTTMTRDKNDNLDSHLFNPTDDFRDETKDEVEGTTDTPQGLIQPVESNKVGEGLEPTIQQDKAVHVVKDSLAEALDAITMDGAEEIEAKPPIGKDPEPDYSKYDEENASHIPLKSPDIPPSLGGDEDKPDSNGLVYVSATFTVDPEKYVSANYRPTNVAQAPNAASAKRLFKEKKPTAVNPEEEAALSDLGTPEAKASAQEADEPTAKQEEAAAEEEKPAQDSFGNSSPIGKWVAFPNARMTGRVRKIVGEPENIGSERMAFPCTSPELPDDHQFKTLLLSLEGRTLFDTQEEAERYMESSTKTAEDEAPEKVVLDYATFIDGSSFICYDEISDIDYSKIAMDAGPKKAPTRATCQTTFAQCRAKNPLFCRFHGPKLLEADIKTAIKSTVGSGCIVQVTKDKNSKNKFTFRLTVGCPPSKKKMVEKMIHMYLTQNPGISSSTEDWNLVGKHKQTKEFEMDILQADKPPKKDTNADQALADTKKAIKAHEKQAVVGETAPALAKKAAKGEKWASVDDAVENEWADLVDKTVHKSLLGNNDEFLDNFNKIANQFDEAHDAGDAEGLKKALDALKAEIGKYDEETGEKKQDNFQIGHEPVDNEQTKGNTEEVVLPSPSSVETKETEPKAEETDKPQETDNGQSETAESVEPQTEIGAQSPTEADIANAAKAMAKVSGFSVSAIKKDIINRLNGKKPITKPVMDFIDKSLPEGDPIREAMQRLYDNGGMTDAVAKAEKSADTALKGSPSPEIRATAERVKESAERAKEQTRIADELGERLGTMKDSKGGLGEAIAKAAVEQAATKAADDASKAEEAATKGAESLEKKSESSYREAERVSKGKAAARVEQLLTAMAQSIFSKDSKSDSIGEEADSIVGWLTKKANEKGIAYSVSDGVRENADAIKAEGEQLEWLMGNLQKEMNATGTDYHEDDLNGLVDSIVRKTAKISGAFAELTSMGLAEIAKINRAAELAEQKAKLGGGTGSGSRPSEQEFQSAAMAIANSGGDVMDDAFSGLAAIIDGKVQGLGSMSSEAMTREMAEEYIKALENDSGNHKKMISALKEAVSKLPQEAVGGGTAEEPQAEKTAKAGTGAGSGDVASRIAKVYEDWVGEDIPDWVSKLSDEDAANYAELLEKASTWNVETEGENTALKELESFENKHSAKAEEAKEADRKEAEAKKQAEAAKVAESHKDILAATRRLGVDAYKPVADLKKILQQTKAHADGNPRMEQRVKDIEAVLADREAKKNQAPREGGRYVGDEMPKEERINLVAKLVAEALEG